MTNPYRRHCEEARNALTRQSRGIAKNLQKKGHAIKPLKIFAIFALFAILNADSPIDTSKVLRPNQALVIDGETNQIDYILEMQNDGQVIKKYLTQSQKEALARELKLDDEVIEALQNPKSRQDAKAKRAANAAKFDKYQKSHIKEWDKSKIIYEQLVEKIYIIR